MCVVPILTAATRAQRSKATITWSVSPPRKGTSMSHGVKLLVFTHKAFLDGKINTRITTIAQIEALKASGDLIQLDTPVTFNCSITSGRTYDLGAPIAIPFP
jgi:hypothetical protein